MARIRTFKPELFSSERVGKLSYPARWTFEALWSLADDYDRPIRFVPFGADLQEVLGP